MPRAGACQPHSPNSYQLSPWLPSSLKPSQQPLSHGDTLSQRVLQPGCFRPRPGRLAGHGGPSLTGGPWTSEPCWELSAWGSAKSRRGQIPGWASPLGICMQVQARNMSWNPSTENKTLRECGPRKTNGCGAKVTATAPAEPSLGLRPPPGGCIQPSQQVGGLWNLHFSERGVHREWTLRPKEADPGVLAPEAGLCQICHFPNPPESFRRAVPGGTSSTWNSHLPPHPPEQRLSSEQGASEYGARGF